MDLNKKSFSTGEIAQICHVSYRTVLRWIDKKILSSYKLPSLKGNNRIEKDNLIIFMKNNNLPIPEQWKIKVNPKILIVDDDKNFVKAIYRALQDENYHVKTAIDGFIAGMVLETFKPDLITLDLNMPGMSGLYVINHLKSHKKFSQIKILVISALNIVELKNAVYQGADGYLQKPFNNSELILKIKSLL